MRECTRRRRRRLAVTVVSMFMTVGAGHATADAPAARGPSVRHLGAATVAEVGRTRVIAFRIDETTPRDRVLEATVSDEAVLRIERDAAVAAGATLGYVRVLGVRPGACDLVVGHARLRVEVVPPRATGDDARFAPRLVGPSSDAVVWGRIAVGVEQRLHPRAALPRVVVRTGDGVELAAVADTGRAGLPHRRLLYTLDLRECGPGPLDLVPVAIADDASETPGPAVRVRVARPDPEAVLTGEAETRYEVARPERFTDDRRNVGRHREASGGAYFVNASAQPAVCFPLVVERPGWYQVMLTAGGTSAQGALPTVGVVVDGGPQSTTNGRLLTEGWHRLAIGVPFRLDAGDHVITPFFANDFFVPGAADRNLHLDRIEVARVRDAAGHAADAGAAMMAGGAMMMGGAAAGGGGVVRDDPLGLSAEPLRIALVRPLHGLPLPGLLEIEGRAWWDGLESRPAPVVTLVVNDRSVGTQRSGAPRFWVDPACFAPGVNRIQLVARLDDGTEARTPVQEMTWPADAAGAGRPPARTHRRFSIHDDRWGDAFAGGLHNRHHPKERRAAVFSSNGSAALRLPDEAVGAHDVFLELMGEAFEGAPVATVGLRADGETAAVGAIPAPGWWDTRRVGGIDLPPGAKTLVVSFENDRHEPGVGDRNLWLQSVILVEQPRVEDRWPPHVELRYPPDRHPVFMADAIVAEATDESSLAAAEVVLDGMPTGLTANLNLRPGRIVLPLILRGLDPGPHTVAIRVTDVTGNSTVSEPRTIVVAAGAPAEPGTFARAVRLLDRFAYGPAPGDLADVLAMGETAWLRDRLRRGLDDAGDLAALGGGMPYFADRNPYAVAGRAVSHLLLTPNPARARFVLWAENHFSTWIRKVDGPRKWAEHAAFSRLGPAPFADLLLASAESPAMLGYLDQDASSVGRLNENYAREIMELHTLGVDGGYTQADVTSLARLFTGWTVSFEGDGRGGGVGARRFTQRFDPRLADGAALRVAGLSFAAAPPADRYDRVRLAIEMLAAHPSTARHVARKLAEHYVGVPAPEALVDDLARRYLATDGDLEMLLLAIAEHASFRSSPARLASPVDYAVRLARVTGHYQPWQVGQFLQRSGRGMFDCPTPDGYPETEARAADSNAMIQRWRLAREFVWPLAGLVPDAWRYREPAADDAWAQRVVDIVAVRVTGRVLGDDSNAAALELARASAGSPDERARLLATFVAQLPESSLR